MRSGGYMKCLVMKFGKGNKRISLLHMRRPFGIGIGGMVTSPMFKEQIPIIVQKQDDSDEEFKLAYLGVGKSGLLPRIVMSEEVFYDIKRGKPYARMILMHELGHFVRKDHLLPKDKRDEERTSLSASGQVSEEELGADAFAVEYLGLETVKQGFVELRKIIETISKDYDGADSALREIDLRLNALTTI